MLVEMDGWMAGSGLAWPYHAQMWQETDLGELALRQMRLCGWVSLDRSEGDSLGGGEGEGKEGRGRVFTQLQQGDTCHRLSKG